MSHRTRPALPGPHEASHHWLHARVAHYLGRATADLDPGAPLSRYGGESRYAFALCSELRLRLGREVHPSVVWNLDSVDAIARHLDLV
ncbi:hypothetical protein GCM10009665_10060 [Kitasatospora nipponensis]|uniref:Polyketide synthase-like phosphopantetheine-binding domain-containing protein n=1 Tax=Kitasatospora nipponensis TaxID=258049 RepID=A0ABN1VSS5_9ACTN